MPVTIIADSGSTKAEWCLVTNGSARTLFTEGISPYFLTGGQMIDIIRKGVSSQIHAETVANVYYYGTGCASPDNARLVTGVLQEVFPEASIEVDTDLMGAARSLCGHQQGIACILGTGTNSCYYDGKNIVRNSPGLGYILGDEGSGAYLGKKVLQYYLYNTFDEDLRSRFDAKYVTTREEILDSVYKKPFPNRYLAGFTMFLSENRGHYMIENIIEDGFNDFFFYHLCKYNEVWKYPVNFVGGVASGFKDVLEELCRSYEFELGTVLKNPMEGLVKYHSLAIS